MTGTPTDDDLLAEAVDWRMQIDASPNDATVRAALDAWLAASDARRQAWVDVEHMTRVARTLPTEYDRRPLAGLPLGVVRHAYLWRPAVAAAALAACLALVFLQPLRIWLTADHQTGIAELQNIVLEDGSTIALDAGSAVTVRYRPDRRDVTLLQGRAFFEVKPVTGRPFQVTAGNVAVSVTGTAFDVRSSNDSVAVAVQSGIVKVALDDGTPAETLTRGQRVEIDREAGRVARSELLPADVAAWRERRLIVDRATMSEVVEELGRHYPGLMVMRDPAFAEQRVSGVFDLRKPIEALQAAVRTHDGRVTRITPYVLVISRH